MIGYVTVKKVYDDREEVVYIERDNTLTDGLSMSLTNLMTSPPSAHIKDFQLGYFQLGDAAHNSNENYSSAQPDSVKKSLYSLARAYPLVDSYGIESTLEVVHRDAIRVKEKWKKEIDTVFTTSSVVAAVLNPEWVSTFDDGILRIKINIDKEAAVGNNIKEFGLFIANPERHLDADRIVMAAYKSLETPIAKTNEFAIDLEWSIDFSKGDFYSDRLGEAMYFYPTVKEVPSGDQYAKYVRAGQTYNALVETMNPIKEGGYLHYELSGDAVEGVHYNITPSSPVFIPKGDESLQLRVQALPNALYYGNKTLDINLKDFTGDKDVTEYFRFGKPNKLQVNIRSNLALPIAEFSSVTVPPGGVVTDLDIPEGTYVASWGAGGGTSALAAVTLNKACLDDVHVFLDISGDGLAAVAGGNVLTIPAGETTGYFTLIGSPGYDYYVSATNLVFGESYYNTVAFPNYFRSMEVPKPLVDYNYINANRGKFNSLNDRPYRLSVGGPSHFYPGIISNHDYKVDSTYSAPPQQNILLKTYEVDDSPDLQRRSDIVYIPKEFYAYPTPDGSPVYITESYAGSEQDAANRTNGTEPQEKYFTSSMTTVALSVHCKNFSSIQMAGAADGDDMILSSKYFALELGSSGYGDLPLGIIGEETVASCRAVFRWDGATLAVDSLTTGGDFTASANLSSIGNGWYRAWLVATVPASVCEGTLGHSLSENGLGAQQYYKLYPCVTSSLRTPSYDSIPQDVSGTQFAYLQYENSYSSDTHDQDYPRPYQSRNSIVRTEREGNCVITDTGNQKTLFTF